MKSYSLSLVGSKPRANLSATYFYSFCWQPTFICIRQFSDWSLKIFMADRDMEEISNGNWDIASSFDFHFRFLIQIFNLVWASKDIIIRYLTLEIIVEQF